MCECEWREIETAPNHTRILAYWPRGNPKIETIDWDSEFYEEMDDMPTHWHALPEPPR
jgi:hypothetical protein